MGLADHRLSFDLELDVDINRLGAKLWTWIELNMASWLSLTQIGTNQTTFKLQAS